MVSRVVPAALVFCLMAFAQRGTMTVNQLREFLRSTIQNKTSDVEVASFLKGVKLSEHLDDRDIEELQGQGLGPKTVAALKKLGDATTSLPVARPEPPPPPPPKPKPPPSSEEQARIVEEARENSLNYTNSLPDYLCLQVTRRYANPYGRDSFTTPYDTLVERLSYVNHHEEYKTVTKNNQVTDVDAIKLGGSLSRGEFASMLREIFERKSRTEFGWERWTRLRDRLTYVFTYRVPLENSEYRIDYESGKQVITVGYHGSLFIDKETNMVVRIKMEADIPAGFPVQQTSQQLDYDYQKIGDQEFLLPLVSEMRGKIDGKFMVRNTIDFKLYRKFSADAQIKFDQMLPETPPPTEENKLKEQPQPK
jgi:hypothetical protein